MLVLATLFPSPIDAPEWLEMTCVITNLVLARNFWLAGLVLKSDQQLRWEVMNPYMDRTYIIATAGFVTGIASTACLPVPIAMAGLILFFCAWMSFIRVVLPETPFQ